MFKKRKAITKKRCRQNPETPPRFPPPDIHTLKHPLPFKCCQDFWMWWDFISMIRLLISDFELIKRQIILDAPDLNKWVLTRGTQRDCPAGFEEVSGHVGEVHMAMTWEWSPSITSWKTRTSTLQLQEAEFYQQLMSLEEEPAPHTSLQLQPAPWFKPV